MHPPTHTLVPKVLESVCKLLCYVPSVCTSLEDGQTRVLRSGWWSLNVEPGRGVGVWDDLGGGSFGSPWGHE